MDVRRRLLYLAVLTKLWLFGDFAQYSVHSVLQEVSQMADSVDPDASRHKIFSAHRDAWQLVKRNRTSVPKSLAMCHWHYKIPNIPPRPEVKCANSLFGWINVQPRLEQLQWQQVSGCPPQMMDKDVANGHLTGSI